MAGYGSADASPPPVGELPKPPLNVERVNGIRERNSQRERGGGGKERVNLNLNKFPLSLSLSLLLSVRQK